MYIEGVTRRRAAHRAAQARLTSKKPVVVIKSGRSKRGAMAAASHTGSLAGSDEIFERSCRQCGVLRAESLEDAFNWCKFLARSARRPGREHGDHHQRRRHRRDGHGRLREIRGATLYDDLRDPESGVFQGDPGFRLHQEPGRPHRPGPSEDYNAALDAALKQDSIHAVIAPVLRDRGFRRRKPGQDDPEATRRVTARAASRRFLHLRRREDRGAPCFHSSGQNAPVFADVYQAVSCLGALSQYRHSLVPPEDVAGCPGIRPGEWRPS